MVYIPFAEGFIHDPPKLAHSEHLKWHFVDNEGTGLARGSRTAVTFAGC